MAEIVVQRQQWPPRSKLVQYHSRAAAAAVAKATGEPQWQEGTDLAMRLLPLCHMATPSAVATASGSHSAAPRLNQQQRWLVGANQNRSALAQSNSLWMWPAKIFALTVLNALKEKRGTPAHAVRLLGATRSPNRGGEPYPREVAERPRREPRERLRFANAAFAPPRWKWNSASVHPAQARLALASQGPPRPDQSAWSDWHPGPNQRHQRCCVRCWRSWSLGSPRPLPLGSRSLRETGARWTGHEKTAPWSASWNRSENLLGRTPSVHILPCASSTPRWLPSSRTETRASGIRAPRTSPAVSRFLGP